MNFKKKIRKIIPDFVISFYHLLWSFLGAIIYRFPGKEIKVIGITGTNGKSTTVKLVTQILKESGKRVAVVSSIDFEIDGEKRKNMMKMTMPGRGFIHKFLREAVDKGCDVAVLEVTSEGVAQHRHRFISFNVAAITNLSPEHIESHGGFENYKRAKGKFFKEVKKTHVLNFDDEYFDYFASFDCKDRYGYGFENQPEGLDLSFKGDNFKISADEISFTVDKEEFSLKLPGKFNAYNGLAAIAIAKRLGIETKEIKKALKKVTGIPGRMEKVIDEEFTVFVDYAFTPNALKQVYSSIEEKMNPNRLIAVLGACGGGRDKWKRPVLGEIAADFAQKVIVTNEDPYDEDPLEIIDQVASGTKGKAQKIIDRREAIGSALSEAKEGDVVIVTGKGSESWIQVKNGKKIPWDDREVIKEEYNKIYHD